MRAAAHTCCGRAAIAPRPVGGAAGSRKSLRSASVGALSGRLRPELLRRTIVLRSISFSTKSTFKQPTYFLYYLLFCRDCTRRCSYSFPFEGKSNQKGQVRTPSGRDETPSVSIPLGFPTPFRLGSTQTTRKRKPSGDRLNFACSTKSRFSRRKHGNPSLTSHQWRNW